MPGDGHPEPHQHAPNMPQTQSLQTRLPLLFSAPSPLDGRAGLKQHLQNPTAPWESTLPPLSNATALHRAPQSLLRVWQSQTPLCGRGMLGLHQRCPSLSVSSSITHSASLSWAHKSPRDPENKRVYIVPSLSPETGANLDFQVSVQACGLLNIPGDTEIWHLIHQYLQKCSSAAEGWGIPSAGRGLHAQNMGFSLPAAPRTQLTPQSPFLPGQVCACRSQEMASPLLGYCTSN